MAVLSASLGLSHAALGAELPAVGADIQRTSVSGLSSGAFMTSQLYVAYSDIMVGAGIVAGGPYLCAKSWSLSPLVINATTTCMNPLTAAVGPNTPLLVTLSESLADAGDIAPLDNLKDDHIYIFSGQKDKTVTTAVVDQTKAYFEAIGVPASAIQYDTSVAAGHALITNSSEDTDCPVTAAPYINDCDFEQSNRIIGQIYTDMKPPASILSSDILAFDQSAFIDSKTTSMSETAYAYIPATCQAGKACAVHVVFHGCKQGAAVIGDKYYADTGYNYVAEANDLIMLYPQVQPSNAAPLNPEGCWDFWGYSSPGDAQPDFYSRKAPQINAVYRMIERLSQPHPL
ncbi:extracellular catalytic domain type 2 short-chain-length polyhydroxyalkanoate depolymerase [Marinobacterium rhizophilum]|uniref:Poly(3-hydroxybutyrate) depolymerase n=1 Tax=Marinobacterium rhizophilum TaxID=420402 RepID=A0ABY5HLJ4_9GAMM|nr:poly(3-hydroxybutyrate) depolymerase [Marinobacterium rhizophilum]UTW12761.1 poly(3-hydroxybutyrate) depolymerase [Marinobacterium rhizophilum]